MSQQSRTNSAARVGRRISIAVADEVRALAERTTRATREIICPSWQSIYRGL